MKKLASLILCLVFVFSSAANTFAAEMQVFLYAPEDEIIKMLKNSESYLVKSLEEDGLTIDTKKVMPVFEAKLSEYAKNEVFEYEPHYIEGKRLYACDVFDENGNFAGYITFTEDDMMMFAPKESGVNTSIDYSAALNIAGIKECIFARLIWVEGAGYVFYAENTDEEYLVKSYIKGTNDALFFEGRKVSLEDALSFVTPEEKIPESGAAVPSFIISMFLLSAAITKKR